VGDSKEFTVESVRRLLITETGTKISRSAYWERTGSIPVTISLSQILARIMEMLADKNGLDPELQAVLGVLGISILILALSRSVRQPVQHSMGLLLMRV